MPVRPSTRTIPAPVVSIVPATDLGSVEVAKRGNRYLLTDRWGDVRVDGRGLGLYDLDTRILSTAILRLNGSALTLLRGPYSDDGVDTIQLTNPEIRRDPNDKRAAASSLARRDLSVTRTRRIEGDVLERVTIVNYSATAEDLELELGLGVDMADIFEVRGYLAQLAARSVRSSCTTIGSSSATTASTASCAGRRSSSPTPGSSRWSTAKAGAARASWRSGPPTSSPGRGRHSPGPSPATAAMTRAHRRRGPRRP